MEKAEFYFKVFSSIVASMYVYHKFITAQLDKKVDKDDCHMTHKFMQELREENSKTLFKSISEIKDRLSTIEKHLLNHK
ncbi:hypothetical protein [Fusobacterium varium]|uniref:hypothetical protein n=1 Tax=Fusobacterium varium TaxID=856 RepID=UPI0022E127F5|nr:hypothetical protein [Fusobacterium varium]